MRKDFYQKKALKEIINTKWFFLTKRPDVWPLPIWYKFKLSSLSSEHKKMYGTNISWVCFFDDNSIEVYLSGKSYGLAIQRATETFYSKEKFNNYLLKTKKICQEVKKLTKEFNQLNWDKFTNQELFNLYIDLINKHVDSFIYGFATWCTQILEYKIKLIIDKYSQKLNKIRISPEEAVSVLIIPEQKTIYQKKNEILSKLSQDYKRNFKKYQSQKFLFQHCPKLHQRIKDFIEQYLWVDFNYNGPVLNYKILIKQLLKLEKNQQFKSPSKENILRVCKFTKEEKYLFYVLRKLSYIKDFRNSVDDYFYYSLSNVYDYLSQRIGMEKKEIQFLWEDELKDLILKNKKFSKKYIKEKQKFCVAISSVLSSKPEKYYIGERAHNFRKNILKKSNFSDKFESQTIIKGNIASNGLVTGIVKSIHSVKEINKVKKGDILVTGMTSSKYMPAIRSSAAIITDDGGLTCHAAIIARELKKPCIIGTKIATKVLRDGDLVEVDANQGIIKIINN